MPLAGLSVWSGIVGFHALGWVKRRRAPRPGSRDLLEDLGRAFGRKRWHWFGALRVSGIWMCEQKSESEGGDLRLSCKQERHGCFLVLKEHPGSSQELMLTSSSVSCIRMQAPEGSDAACPTADMALGVRSAE